MKKTKSLLLVLSLLFTVSLFSATDRLISRFERARPKFLDAQKYFNKGKLKKAEKAIRVCLKRMPEYSDAHELLAKIHIKNNKLNEALENSNLAIKNYKYRYIIYRYFSDRTNNQKSATFAEGRVDPNTNLTPSSDEIKLREEKKLRIKNIEARYYFQNANILFKLKKFRDAHTKYLKAIEINPKYGDAYNNLANLYYLSKQYQLALDSLNKARDSGAKINPKFEAFLKKKLNK